MGCGCCTYLAPTATPFLQPAIHVPAIHALTRNASNALVASPPVQYDCEEDRRPRWPKVPEWCIPEKPDYGKKVGFQVV